MARKVGATKLTQEKRAAFLTALRAGASVSAACKSADISRPTAYKLYHTDQHFAREWDYAIEQGTDTLEDVALRRATVGVQRNIYHKGQVVGTHNEVSDTLLIFLLKARRPEKYRERVDLSNRDGTLLHAFRAAVHAANGMTPDAAAEDEQGSEQHTTH